MRKSHTLFLIFACAVFACAPADDEPKDMAYIPAGSFMMGSTDGDDNEKPVHEVYVEAFYMDKYEVTVAQYQQFIKGMSHRQPENWQEQLQYPKLPVIYVSWDDANTYAKWAKKRLPTEAEWEYAARSGNKGYKYSWGNGSPIGRKGGNIVDETAKHRFTDLTIWSGYDDGYVFTAPVGSFEPNEFGLFDMTGNVSEWCADWYDENYYASSPKQNPQGPASAIGRVLRGGAWSNYPDLLRCAVRGRGDTTYRTAGIGFRCVQDVR